MTSAPPPAPDQLPPLLIRQPPPTTARLSKKTLLGVFLGIGGILIIFFGLKLQSKHNAQQVVPSPPLPRAHEVVGEPPKDHTTKLRQSYEGLDRRAPAPPPPPVEAAELAPAPPPWKPVVFEPSPPVQLPPVARAPLPPPPAGPAPLPKQPPKKWLFAEPIIAKAPFQAPERQEKPETEATGSGLLHPATWVQPADPTRVLYRSQVIAGILTHALNSDVPGPVRIMVTRQVTDQFHQGQVLIPQYTRILGKMEQQPSFGQRRLNIIIDEMQFPNGTLVQLSGQAADRSGATGIGGKVNNHWPQLIAGTVLTALLHIGTRAPFGSSQNYQPSLEQEFSKDVASGVSRSGQSVIERSLQIKPTITVKPGTEITVELEQNLSFATPPTVGK